MPQFSKQSQIQFDTLHPDLQRVLEAAIAVTDFGITCGHRSQADQEAAFLSGKSKLQPPNSKHNTSPSEAVDLVPYPVDWEDRERFFYLAGVIMTVASSLGVPLRWGGDWDMDKLPHERGETDLPHFELKT
jgi:peptidoglycan L-alanyl-D-glutamate endopeptidase CwlK